MPEPNDQLTVKLTVTEWNQILQILGEGPYRIVAPLAGKITAQANAQLAPAPAIGNGITDVPPMPLPPEPEASPPPKRAR